MEANLPLGDDEQQIIYPNPLPWSEWQRVLAHCYAHGTMVAQAGGLILQKLKELGLDENTLVIWLTDHGDAVACQSGHFDKDSHMAQEVMRIPLAMVWKGIIPLAQENDQLAFTCDIPVTLLDAAQIAFPSRVDGRSLLDLAIPQRACDDWRDSLLCETYGHGYGTTIIGRLGRALNRRMSPIQVDRLFRVMLVAIICISAYNIFRIQ